MAYDHDLGAACQKLSHDFAAAAKAVETHGAAPTAFNWGNLFAEIVKLLPIILALFQPAAAPPAQTSPPQ